MKKIILPISLSVIFVLVLMIDYAYSGEKLVFGFQSNGLSFKVEKAWGYPKRPFRSFRGYPSYNYKWRFRSYPTYNSRRYYGGTSSFYYRQHKDYDDYDYRRGYRKGFRKGYREGFQDGIRERNRLEYRNDFDDYGY